MRVVPLSHANIQAALALTERVFPYDFDTSSSPKFAFPASLSSEKDVSFLKTKNITSLEYFVLLNDENNVVGTTGLYVNKADSSGVVWLGWFCIDPNFRGRGLGKYLLSWTIAKAKEKGFTSLRLYTSDNPNEKAAQFLYSALGFSTYKTEKHIAKDETQYMYKEKLLTD